MKITISMLLLCLLASLKLQAQSNYTVKGIIIDTTLNVKLSNAAVCVLNAKDSTLQQFTRAAVNGAFTLNHLKKGKLILLVSYPGYADYVEQFALDSAKSTHAFGSISMVLKARLLQDVIIKGTAAAIKIKGDTTEFNAAAFKIQPNAKVEDLLKQLPGIQVDKDGKITAQGQTVPKVLVDGEEFFGDDPTLVTKNLRADMVDKVQLYDKKSDQAAFTGIDDGNTTKTINIKLKEDKKTGFFGKAEGSIGTDGYYQEQLMYNRFKGKQKLSVYGIGANTGKVGLGWQDANKYGVNNIEFTDNGGFIVSGGGNDDLDSFGGRYNGQGIPKALTGGVHYDNKWNKDKQSVNTNYKIGSLEVDGSSNNQVQNNLPSGIIKSNSDQNYNNSIFRQKLDITYQIKLDTASNLKIMVDGTAKTTKTRNKYASFSTNGNDDLLNRNNRNLDNNVNNQIANLSAFYTHKFKKTGRTFSLSMAQSENKSQAKGYLNSETDFYDTTGGIDNTQSVNQYKTNNITNSTFSSNATYTEPFSKKTSMIFNYGIGVNNNNADRKSFNQSAPGVYDQFDSKYSNNYQLDQFSNQAGAIFNYQTPKTTLNFGTKVSNVDFKQIDEYTGNIYKRNFINWNPQASYKYKFSQYKGLRINYLGATVQPTIDQIQPIIVNTDPLNITMGNPNLTPSFRNSFYVGYNSYKVLSDQNVYVNARWSMFSNAIVDNTTRDAATGKSTYQSVNLTGHTPIDFYAYVGASKKMTPAGINVGFDGGVNGSVYYAYVNGKLNTTNSYTFTPSVSVRKYVQKKYDFNLWGGPNYTISKSSLQPLNNNGSGFTLRYYTNLYLPGKFQIGSDGNYEYRGKTQSFNETYSRFLINASISKTFLKQDNLKLSASCNDLLNQNTGFNRAATGTTITQNTYTTIRRYLMFTISWDFSKFGAGTQSQKSN